MHASLDYSFYLVLVFTVMATNTPGKPKRESKADDKDFSDWVLFMQRYGSPEVVKRRDEIGYVSKNWTMLLRYQLNGCGIYEIQIRRAYIKPKIVYVGSTCRKRNDCSLERRLSEYTRNGSHKKELIDQALRWKYDIYVRIKKLEIRSDAKIETSRSEQKIWKMKC